jgi:class 3 adenylate cyclase
MTTFVPKLVSRRLAQDPSPLTEPMADRCSAAVMFADISGFTALAERLSLANEAAPERLANLLNRCFARLIEIVDQHGGEVTKFAGDGLLALWPVPEHFARLGVDARRALGEQVRRASQCALVAREELSGLEVLDGIHLTLGIGLGAGDVYSVHLGGVFGRWEFLLSGTPLVQMSLAKERAMPGNVVLSPEAWALAEGACQGRELPGGFVELDQLTVVDEPARTATPHLGPAAIEGLKAYIPAAILARLGAGQVDWLSELRRVSVLFIKLPGYGTSITHPYARTLPEAQAVMTALQTALYHFAGSINKFNVDDKGITLVAAMGLPPLSHSDDSVRAIRAALEMQTALRELGRPSAIGVATGTVFCGPVGHASRREYTVVGNDVNMAARMMQAAELMMEQRRQSSIVLCDEATYLAVQAQQERSSRLATGLTFRHHPGIQVKGKAEPVSAFEPQLGDRRIYPSSRRRRGISRLLVGRDKERLLLNELLLALHDDDGEQTTSVVFIEGEPGVGKSQLIRELLLEAEKLGLGVLRGQGRELEAMVPFHAWRSVFRQLFSLELPYVDISRQRASVLSRLPMMPGERGYPALALRLSPLLNSVLPLEFPENKLTAGMPPPVRVRTTRLFLLRLLQLAFTSPRRSRVTHRFIVLEDVQWMDLASWELALSVSRQVRPLLLVLVTRTLPAMGHSRALPAPCQRLLIAPRTIRVDVSALEQHQVAELVRQSLGVGSVARELGPALFQRTGGVPLFIEELLNSWAAAGLIRVSPERCDMTCRTADLLASPPPDAVSKTITGRIDRLEPGLQLLLKVASVAGETFTVKTLKRAYPERGERHQVEAMVKGLVDEGYLRPAGSGPSAYRFAYSLLQEVILGMPTQEQRRRIQRLVDRAS